jgi:hypothetical protein
VLPGAPPLADWLARGPRLSWRRRQDSLPGERGGILPLRGRALMRARKARVREQREAQHLGSLTLRRKVGRISPRAVLRPK